MSQLFNNVFRRQRLQRKSSRRAKLWLEHLESRIVLDARLSIFVDSEQIEIPANIGVDDDGRRKFKARRSNAGFKSRWLQQIAMNPPAWVFGLVNYSNAATLKRLKTVRKRVKSFNKAREKRQPLSEGMRATLREYYSSDVEKLSRLLGRDLTHWTKP